MDKYVLVACEESQRVCIAFRKRGFIAYSCDIQDCSGGYPGWHIKCDCLLLLDENVSFVTCDGKRHFVPKWDLLIAFPPCTYFSRINFLNYWRKGVFNSKRFADSKYYVDLFLALYNANIPHICIENPVPFSLFDNILPAYTMCLQPYEFGEKYSKKTCLWLKGLPCLMPTQIVLNHEPYVVLNGNLIGGKFNAAECSIYRSKTFYGVANAMAEQWGCLL